MAISISWGTRVINVPQTDLTLIGGTLYELDTDAFRLTLKNLEDSEEGMPFPDTHVHNTEVTVAGVTYARFVEIVNGYSVTFEDGQYSVRLTGSNNNIFDIENNILNQNQVQVIPGNSAGLVVVGGGLAPTKEEIRQEMDNNSTQLAAIVEDSGITIPALIAALHNFNPAVDTVATVTDVTNLHADWQDDGRLDLLIDGIKAVTDLLPDGGALTTLLNNITEILTDTDELQTDNIPGAIAALPTANTIADAVLEELISDHKSTPGSLAEIVNMLDRFLIGRTVSDDNADAFPKTIEIYDTDNATLLRTLTITQAGDIYTKVAS